MTNESGRLFPRSSSAVMSPCERYRYRLDRQIGPTGPAAAFIMVNPSTADHQEDDATIRKVQGFAARYGYGRVIVGNLFALRATDIKEVGLSQDPVGPDNDRYLKEIIAESSVHLIAWGALSKLPRRLRGRAAAFVSLARDAGVKLHCLGVTKEGDPLHPCMIGYDRPVVEWKPRSA